MLQDYEEASEITQEAFLAAWQGLPSFRGEARFSTWLYRIAYNSALKQIEQRKRDKALESAMQAEQIIAEAGNEGRMETELELHARQDFIRENLATLPAKYRAVLILRHIQDMTYEEMAEILTVPIGTIKTHLFRARNLLKERLEAFDPVAFARRQRNGEAGKAHNPQAAHTGTSRLRARGAKEREDIR
jgi:RNA polymerase sigma-70 factor (ECF subfamily)